MRRRRVIALEPVTYSLDSVLPYGPVQYLFEQGRRARPSGTDTRFTAAVRKRLLDLTFDPEKDYVLLVGCQASIARMLAVMVNDYGGKNIECLAFNPRVSSYNVTPAL